MTYVGGLGFPVPRVYVAEGTDLVLRRLDGPTLLQALRDGEPLRLLDQAVALRAADADLTRQETDRLAPAAALVRANC